MNRRIKPWIAGAVVLALFVVADIVLAVTAHRAGGDDAAAVAALASAEARVPAMLTYDHASLEQDLIVADANTTGAFGREFSVLLRDVVAPRARKNKVSTEASVAAASVVSRTDRSVVLLMFLTQATTSGKDATPVLTGSRVEVTMNRTDAGWFVAGLEPV